MTLKIVGDEQIVCDCQGNTPDTYQDELLVGVNKLPTEFMIRVFCPECDSKLVIRIPIKLSASMKVDDRQQPF